MHFRAGPGRAGPSRLQQPKNEASKQQPTQEKKIMKIMYFYSRINCQSQEAAAATTTPVGI